MCLFNELSFLTSYYMPGIVLDAWEWWWIYPSRYRLWWGIKRKQKIWLLMMRKSYWEDSPSMCKIIAVTNNSALSGGEANHNCNVALRVKGTREASGERTEAVRWAKKVEKGLLEIQGGSLIDILPLCSQSPLPLPQSLPYCTGNTAFLVCPVSRTLSWPFIVIFWHLVQVSGAPNKRHQNSAAKGLNTPSPIL